MKKNKYIESLIYKVPIKVKTAFFAWVLINVSLLIISGHMRDWRFYSYDDAIYYMRGGSIHETTYSSSLDVFFPFQRERTIADGYTNDYYVCQIKAFQVQYYDWSELLVYILIPLLSILYYAKEQMKNDKTSSIDKE